MLTFAQKIAAAKAALAIARQSTVKVPVGQVFAPTAEQDISAIEVIEQKSIAGVPQELPIESVLTKPSSVTVPKKAASIEAARKPPVLTDGMTDRELLSAKSSKGLTDAQKKRRLQLIVFWNAAQPKKKHGLGAAFETLTLAPIKFAIRSITVPIRTAKAIHSGKLKGAAARRALGDTINPITATMVNAGNTGDSSLQRRMLNYGRMAGTSLTWKTGTNRRIKSHGFAGAATAAVVAATVLTFGGAGGAAAGGGGVAAGGGGGAVAGAGAGAAAGAGAGSTGIWATVTEYAGYASSAMGAVKTGQSLLGRKKPTKTEQSTTAVPNSAAMEASQAQAEQVQTFGAVGIGALALLMLL